MKWKKSKICGGGLNAGQSHPHPPSKEAAIPHHARKGLENYLKGGTVVHRREGFPGVLKHRGFFLCLVTTYPRPAHPITYQSYPPHFISQSRDIWLSRPSREEIQHLRLWQPPMTSHRLSIPEAE